MGIDLNALRRIAEGDPTTKVAVKREWLREVLKSLEELERIKGQRKIGDGIRDMMEHLGGYKNFKS